MVFHRSYKSLRSKIYQSIGGKQKSLSSIFISFSEISSLIPNINTVDVNRTFGKFLIPANKSVMATVFRLLFVFVSAFALLFDRPTSSEKTAISMNGTFLYDIPPCKQRTERLMVAIVLGGLADLDRQLILVRQLDLYVQMCEEGFEVHVILVTYQQNFTENYFGFNSKTRYLCHRLQRILPIIPWIFNHPLDYLLTAYHRRLFLNFRTDYDWFISQEDDMVVNQLCFAYFRKWSKRFDGSKFYPGFMVTEVPTNIYNMSELHVNAPMLWLPFTGGYQRHLNVFERNGSLLVAHWKAWVPAFMLSQTMLEACSEDPAWRDNLDELVHWREPNAHFQHMWLPRNYSVVIPIEDLQSSWMHHSPNKYSNMEWELLRKGGGNRNLFVHVDEFAAILANCTGVKFNRGPWTLEKIVYKIPGLVNHALPCRQCTADGKAASMSLHFPEHKVKSILNSSTSSVVVELHCTGIKEIKQEIAGYY